MQQTERQFLVAPPKSNNNFTSDEFSPVFPRLFQANFGDRDTDDDGKSSCSAFVRYSLESSNKSGEHQLNINAVDCKYFDSLLFETRSRALVALNS